MTWSLGALLIPVIIHIAALVFNAAVGATSDCSIAAIWCGSPFEAIMSSFDESKDYNFFTLSLSLMSGALQLMLGLILLDYDVLKSQEYGAFAAVGDGIRIVSGITLLGVTITGAMAIFRR